jgi:hypothetical protein
VYQKLDRSHKRTLAECVWEQGGGEIFGPKKGGLRRLHNGEVCNFYSSPDINRMIKSIRMNSVGM